MDYIKIAEKQLNNYKETEELTRILPQILVKNKIEIDTIKNVLGAMESKEREIIQRICINGEKPKDLEKVYKISSRQIYRNKNEALQSFTERLYGKETIKNKVETENES